MKLRHVLLITFLAALLGSAVLGVLWWRSGKWKETVLTQVGDRLIKDQNQITLLHQLLGFDKSQTYLVLFLNNSELRPGGGFIGTYSVIKAENGSPNMVVTEGTGNLDYRRQNEDLPEPPGPLKKYLKLDKWYFRDSNWSPDFRLAAEKGLELYKIEHGVERDNITGVVGITPTVMEEVLKITGPIKINGEEINTQNFLEKVEYEVEYGYAKKGIPLYERKFLLSDLTKVMLDKLKTDVLFNWSKYYGLWNRMLAEKQVMFYSLDPQLQNIFHEQNWSGEMKQAKGDYLLWVDANLGALKTDLVIKRELSYTIKPSSSSTEFIATAKMRYVHSGGVDWRTTNYLSYVRIFVPEGSKLLNVSDPLSKEKKDLQAVDSGIENGKQWFGTFINVRPRSTKDVYFTYQLPAAVASVIKSGDYKLDVQKQLGSLYPTLNLSLDFGREVISASPGEKTENYGDNSYKIETDLFTDRAFVVKLK